MPSPTAYYNEIDEYAAAWLRNLIAAGHIANGVVDTRSIVDVRPDDLDGFTQAHFFAGIGGWSFAARLAGWPDDRPVWTGSCPCQPFSAAGKGGGFDDERHLWPEWFRLIAANTPPVIFGEQVASPAGLGWLDLVSADMERAGYAFGATDICAASVGAPHIRQRLWFVADSLPAGRSEGRAGAGIGSFAGECGTGELADSERTKEPRQRRIGRSNLREQDAARLAGSNMAGRLDVPGTDAGVLQGRDTGGMADSDGGYAGAEGIQRGGQHGLGAQDAGIGDIFALADSNVQFQRPLAVPVARAESETRGRDEDSSEAAGLRRVGWPRPTHSPWGNPDWLYCRDGKWRPVEPGTFPLAHGIPGRVGRLRAYGNAIVPQVAAEIIGAYLDATNLPVPILDCRP